MGVSRRFLAIAGVAVCLGLAGRDPGAVASSGSVRPASPGGGGAGDLPAGAVPWERWQRGWMRLDSLEVSARTLSDLADFDAMRAGLLDSLCGAAGPARGEDSADPEGASVPGAAPPSGTGTFSWTRRTILDALFLGEPRPARLLVEEWDPVLSQSWNGDGLFTLPAAVLLVARGNPGRALSWLEGSPVPPRDESYAAVLAAECRTATGDTMGAGLIAQARLARVPPLPSWARESLEEVVIRGALASGDTAQARALLDTLPSARDRRAFILPSLRRLALLRGDGRAADSLAWRAAREYPGGRTAEKLLREAVSPDDRVDPAFSSRADRIRVLLAVAESRGDAARFRALVRVLSPSPGTARGDSLAIRAARTAWKARDYEGLVQWVADRAWRAGGPFADEWELITARALRNTARIDSMAARYAIVADRGSLEDRRTALWEWAREMEAQRRFVEADSLYGRFVAAGAGDQRVQALLRRGICRIAQGAPERGRAILEPAAIGGTGEEQAAAWFWIYRAELARGRALEARTALAKAAETRAGYYAQRARSALALAREPGGPPVDDPEAYWREVARLGGEGNAAPAPAAVDSDSGAAPVGRDIALGRDSTAIGSDSGGGAIRLVTADSAAASSGPDSLRSGLVTDGGAWIAPGQVRAICDRLQLFRLAGRTDWAKMEREDLLAAPALGTGATRVRRLLDLRLPDLAARAAGNLATAPARLRHPFPHAPAVAAASRRFGVAPEWAWAVMRRESLYESAVVSGAGAVGLMQLGASTAELTAKRHGIPAGPLEAPRVNLLLGVAHLGDLAVEARGNWPFVLAAYNAGTVPARRWQRSGEDPDLYIEMIGYRETRDYARRVLETFWTCRELLRGKL